MEISLTCRPEEIAGLIELIYEGPSGPERWSPFLEQLSQLGGFHAAMLRADCCGSHTCESVWSHAIPPKSIESYRSYYQQIDPYLPLATRCQSERIFTSQQIMPAEDLEQTEYYREWAGPLGLHHGVAGVSSGAAGVLSTFLTAWRRAGDPECEAAETSLLRVLIPHLRRALRAEHRLKEAESECMVSADLLDRLPVGVIVVDQNLHILRCNRGAERILGVRDGLLEYAGALQTDRKRDTNLLRALVVEAIEAAEHKPFLPGGALPLERPSGGRPLALTVSPVRFDPLRAESEHRVAAILVSDGAAQAPFSMIHLRQLYELTRAESELASLMARGYSLDEAADYRGIQIATARGQLKSIFLKTETRRQAELVRLIATGPALLDLEDCAAAPA